MIGIPNNPRCSKCGTIGIDNLRMIVTVTTEQPLDYFRNMPNDIALTPDQAYNIAYINWEQKNGHLVCLTCGYTNDFSAFEDVGYSPNAYLKVMIDQNNTNGNQDTDDDVPTSIPVVVDDDPIVIDGKKLLPNRMLLILCFTALVLELVGSFIVADSISSAIVSFLLYVTISFITIYYQFFESVFVKKLLLLLFLCFVSIAFGTFIRQYMFLYFLI